MNGLAKIAADIYDFNSKKKQNAELPGNEPKPTLSAPPQGDNTVNLFDKQKWRSGSPNPSLDQDILELENMLNALDEQVNQRGQTPQGDEVSTVDNELQQAKAHLEKRLNTPLFGNDHKERLNSLKNEVQQQGEKLHSFASDFQQANQTEHEKRLRAVQQSGNVIPLFGNSHQDRLNSLKNQLEQGELQQKELETGLHEKNNLLEQLENIKRHKELEIERLQQQSAALKRDDWLRALKGGLTAGALTAGTVGGLAYWAHRQQQKEGQ